MFTLIGGGLCKPDYSKRLTREVFPKEISIIKKSVKLVQPKANKIILDDNDQYTYDYLIIAAGISPDWDSIKGAREALAD